MSHAQPTRRHLRLFLGGQSVSLLGDGLGLLAIPLLVLEVSRNPVVSALSAASLTLGHLCVGLPAGVLVDRLDPWRVLMAMDAARTLLFAALFAASATGTATVGLILVIAVTAGACHVLFDTALVVVVKDLFAAPGLLRANSTIELARQASLLVGPGVTAGLAALGGLRTALLVDALSFGVSLLSLAAVRRRVPGPRRPAAWPRWRDMTRDVREGLRYLLSVRTLVILTVVQMVVNLCLAVEKLIYFYGRDTLGLSASAVSVVAASAGAGGIAGALSAAPLARRTGQMRLIVAAVVACGTAVAAMSLATTLGTLMLATAASAWAVVTASVVNRTQRQQIVPRALLGRVTGTGRLLYLAVDPLGVLVTGGATAALGGDPRPVFLAAGVVVAATALAGWRAGLRDHPS
ncbi:MFS transporter [Actinomadura sp. NPDC047616]|uniref:MFS transporter n=1 Tax=Actinomadura sp. NPDC047616 TaxID=3155914 RepID=UPI0033D02C12